MQRNGTTWGDGVFNIHTGEDDISLMGKINTWNYAKQTHFDGECGAIKGSAGGFYPPGTKGDSLLLFSHEACRYVLLLPMYWYLGIIKVQF